MAKIAIASIELTDPKDAGRSIAEVLKFLMRRINAPYRPKRIQILKNKLQQLHETSISNKYIPENAVLGQCISLVMNSLHGQNPQYIRSVITNIINHLPYS